ncbi:hypothetical protein ASA1KI_09800 [Opitutales bacterium ASA1]|uniref:hypothetical protein n=1 Tax=Congregicoccus parvus TaxID=3081749 RepID=UPI002B2F318B|nr:hypothetical protein ASA1KI_09800 [Opitutales bacterium ASA1]
MHEDSSRTRPEAARYRVVVRSAAEAVEMVRERFGDAARVVSVRQIEAGGLARFLQKPRLEVIVEVHAPQPRLQAFSADVAMPTSEDATEASEAVSATESVAETSDETSAREEAPPPPRARRGREISILRATGLDDLVLERVRSENPGLDWATTPASEALTRIAASLRKHYAALPRRKVGPRKVFLGPCGAGKTTALCKMIAHDVFVSGRTGAVLKLDGENATATDGVAAFCDVLGAPLLRSAAEVREFETDSSIWVDVPGVSLDAGAEHRRLAQTLDALEVDTRILVVHAGWEIELIADAYEMGRACRATHVYFSHLDEVRRPGKLWRFALFGGLTPLAGGSGPSPAGELELDLFGAMLARTVPGDVARAAGREGGVR